MGSEEKAPPSDDRADAEIAELKDQIKQLSFGRDKLTKELDLQVEETDRLTIENAALTQAMLNARKMCMAWEGQTNNSLIQIDRLKDLLEESAQWRSPSQKLSSLEEEAGSAGKGTKGNEKEGGHAQSSSGEGGEAAGTASAGVGGSTPLTRDTASLLENLEAQLMEERSKAAQLEVCLRAVAAEVTRASTITSDLQNSTLPLLAGMEARLNQLLKLTATNLKAQP